MTRSDLMSIVTAMISTSGVPYITGSTAQNAKANARLAKFTERTRCLYDDAIPFTLNPGGTIPSNGVYDLRGAAFTKQICGLDILTIDSTPLNDFEGNRGIGSLCELREALPSYVTDAAAKPIVAVRIPPTSVRLYPVPDQAYSNCFAAGYVLHPAISTSSGGDNTVLSIPDEYCETAAVYVAISLVLWGVGEESDYERMSFFSKAAAQEMAELEDKTESQMDGPTIRGAVRGRRRGFVLA